MALHIETPLLASSSLSAAAGRTVWLKLESLQPSGSFKLRGIGVACETYMRQGKLLFISSSGGNAGIAVAYAGSRLSIPVTVVVPESTTARAKALIRQYGAEVIVHGMAWDDANDAEQQDLQRHAALPCHDELRQERQEEDHNFWVGEVRRTCVPRTGGEAGVVTPLTPLSSAQHSRAQHAMDLGDDRRALAPRRPPRA